MYAKNFFILIMNEISKILLEILHLRYIPLLKEQYKAF